MQNTTPHRIRPLQVHQKQDADRRHTPCSEKRVILWPQFHKVSQPDWLLRNETDIPQVVCCRSLSTANCGHSLTWSPRSHTHTQSSQRLRLLTRLRTARRLDWGQRNHACISGGRHYSVPVFLFASSYLRTGK